jgi:hypothetical protein
MLRNKGNLSTRDTAGGPKYFPPIGLIHSGFPKEDELLSMDKRQSQDVLYLEIPL